MKCISCETEINPKWKHAIDINVCPFCGKHIMEEHLKNLLSSLSSTMGELQQYPDQLNDFMLSNYNYIKTDSPDLKNYLPKEVIKELHKEIGDAEFQEKKSSTVKLKLPDGTTQEVLVEKTQSEEKTNSFFERAEVLKGSGKTSGKAPKSPDEPEPPKSVAERTQHLKKVAQQIKREGAQAIISEGGMASMMSPEAIADADPEAVAEYQSVIDGGDIVTSALPDPLGDEDATTDRILAANLRAAQKKGASSQDKDMETLREMQNKVANAQKRLGSGGFSRS